MFTIGEFARHGRVSVRMLRHYDATGLLRPARVGEASGYRFYAAGQLARLNRIIALKDLGFSLDQVREMLDEQVSAEQLRGMLRLRQAELRSRLTADQARLAQVEARLQIIEREGAMSADDIQVKQIPAVRVAELTGPRPASNPPPSPRSSSRCTRSWATGSARAGLTPARPAIAYYEATAPMRTPSWCTPRCRSTPTPAPGRTSRSWTCPPSSRRRRRGAPRVHGQRHVHAPGAGRWNSSRTAIAPAATPGSSTWSARTTGPSGSPNSRSRSPPRADPLDPQVVRPVDTGPQVSGRGDACELAELIDEMRLVAVAVPGGDGGPVGPGLAGQRPGAPAQPVHPGEALGREAHPGGEAAAQRAGEQPRSLATRPTGTPRRRAGSRR